MQPRLLQHLINRSNRNRMIPGPRRLINLPRPFLTLRRLRQLLIQRLDILPPPHFNQKALQPSIRRRVVISNRHQQPLIQNLAVSRLGEMERRVQFRHLLPVQRLRQRRQKMQPLLRGKLRLPLFPIVVRGALAGIPGLPSRPDDNLRSPLTVLVRG